MSYVLFGATTSGKTVATTSTATKDFGIRTITGGGSASTTSVTKPPRVVDRIIRDNDGIIDDSEEKSSSGGLVAGVVGALALAALGFAVVRSRSR